MFLFVMLCMLYMHVVKSPVENRLVKGPLYIPKKKLVYMACLADKLHLTLLHLHLLHQRQNCINGIAFNGSDYCLVNESVVSCLVLLDVILIFCWHDMLSSLFISKVAGSMPTCAYFHFSS